MSNTDLETINHEFDKIYNDNRGLASVLTNHTKILKLLLDASSADYKYLKGQVNNEARMAEKVRTILNTNMRDNFINPKFLLASIFIDETNDDVDLAINAINDVENGIIHPQILTPKILKETIQDFETQHGTRYHFDNTEENYQHCRI